MTRAVFTPGAEGLVTGEATEQEWLDALAGSLAGATLAPIEGHKAPAGPVTHTDRTDHPTSADLSDPWAGR